jgi:hypothetical protein
VRMLTEASTGLHQVVVHHSEDPERGIPRIRIFRK